MIIDPSSLSIKFHRPAPPAKRVQRAGLIQRLDEGLSLGRPVTLVSAPAGFGKTTCISEWLEGLDLPAAWLSVDADDNDPMRCFASLAAALRAAGERLGENSFAHFAELERVLRAGQLPPQEVIAGSLIADVTRLPGRFLLVLDDFHLIHEHFILQVFEKLITSLFQPDLPRSLHLVLLAREDPALPMARLRAHNLLTEIRAADLRFNTEEAGAFLKEVMDLDLPQPDIATLEERTEGWIVGLQLAGLSIRGSADPSRLIAGLSGGHRYILSYLIEEVLSRQPEDVQQFLLDTSILDRLSAGLCSAVTGRADSPVVLERLLQANLFLTPLDDGQRWFRYHHLFGELLRSRQALLQGEKTAELHQRASRWFAQACRGQAKSASGERAALAGEAIHHALVGEDYDAAVQLLEEHAMEIINQWYARKVTAWIQALPPEWGQKSPRINLAFARMHLINGDFAQAGPYLERLQALFASPQDAKPAAQITRALTAEWLALQSTILSGQGRAADALVMAQQALAAAPDQDSSVLSQVYLALAVAYQQVEDAPKAREAYRTLIHLGRASGDLTAELLGISALVLMMIQTGELRDGYELALQGARRVEQSGMLPPISLALYGELGQIAYDWHQLDQADAFMRRAQQVSNLGGFSDAEIYYRVYRSRVALLQGELSAAAEEIRGAADRMQVDAPVVVREEVIAQQVSVFLAQGNLPAAEQTLFQEVYTVQGRYGLPDIGPGETIAYSQGELFLSGLRILLWQARQPGGAPPADSAAQGIKQSGRLLEAFQRRQYVPLAVMALLLRGQFFAVLGDAEASLADYAAAVDLAEPGGSIGPFLAQGASITEALAQLLRACPPSSRRGEFIQRILAACAGLREPGATPEPDQAGLVEPLTGRELDVLRLVAEGQTYESIAARLVVSINTVRTHVKAIYGKLGANNRTAAIAAARKAGLL